MGFERGDQAGYHVSGRLFPFLLSQALASSDPDVVFKGPFPVRKMAELHRFHDAIHYHGGTETGAEPQEEHLATFVAPQSLHGRIVDYFDRTVECNFKVEPGPSRSKVNRFRQRTISDNYPRIPDRYRVIPPILRKVLDAGDHLFRG